MNFLLFDIQEFNVIVYMVFCTFLLPSFSVLRLLWFLLFHLLLPLGAICPIPFGWCASRVCDSSFEQFKYIIWFSFHFLLFIFPNVNTEYVRSRAHTIYCKLLCDVLFCSVGFHLIGSRIGSWMQGIHFECTKLTFSSHNIMRRIYSWRRNLDRHDS